MPGDAEGLAEVFWGRYDQPEPVAPSNKEVVELVARLRDWHSVPLLSERERAAALLERLVSDNAGLAQQPVSQPYKLPEPAAPTDDALDELEARS
jgi:hypothetical protein